LQYGLTEQHQAYHEKSSEIQKVRADIQPLLHIRNIYNVVKDAEDHDSLKTMTDLRAASRDVCKKGS